MLRALIIITLLLACAAPGRASVADLRLNELQADNEGTLADDHDEFDDWFELVNTGGTSVSLGGLLITDDADLIELYPLDADLTLPPGGYLVLWADGQPDQGPAHLPIRLSSAGEFLALVADDGVTVIDQVSFGRQFPDRVYQRYPDRTGAWTWGRDPSPGTANNPPRLAGFLALNELMTRNLTTLADEAGDHDPWLELVNPLPVPVDLAGVRIDALGGGTHAFGGEVLAAAGRLLLWADAEPEQGLHHLSFTLEVGGGALLLTAPDGVQADQVIYPALDEDQAYARIPDATGLWFATALATPGSPNPASLEPPLVINELLASNQSGITDEMGEHEDWLELFNPGSAPVHLAGLSLTDDLAEPAKFPLPDVIVAPGGFLVIWCDDDPEDGPLHASFKLAAAGEEVALFQGEDLVDHVVFGPQTADVSYARERDAELPWIFCAAPTPGASNNGGVAVGDHAPSLLRLDPPFPNPFNPRVRLPFSLQRALPVWLTIHDARGRRVRQLLHGARLEAGNHAVTWDGRDDSGRGLPSGVYRVRLRAGNAESLGAATLLR